MRNVRRVTMCLSLALSAAAGQARAADEIHSFVDDHGLQHFSNVPADPRYRFLLQATVASEGDSTSDPPAVIMFAPPIVEGGSEFVLNVILANSARVYGSLEIGFDPAALSFRDANVRYDRASAGRIRLDVHGEPSAGFSADLKFRVKAKASSETNISLAHASLTAENGKPATVNAPSVTSIAILSLGR